MIHNDYVWPFFGGTSEPRYKKHFDSKYNYHRRDNKPDNVIKELKLIVSMLDRECKFEWDRGSRGHDKKTGYRTKTVLCHPIWSNSSNSVIGAIQIINKKNGQLFSSEDISL